MDKVNASNTDAEQNKTPESVDARFHRLKDAILGHTSREYTQDEIGFMVEYLRVNYLFDETSVKLLKQALSIAATNKPEDILKAVDNIGAILLKVQFSEDEEAKTKIFSENAEEARKRWRK